MKDLLHTIDTRHLSDNSVDQINIPSDVTQSLREHIDEAKETKLPSLAGIFDESQEHVEQLLYSNVYPDFVRQQMSIAAKVAYNEDGDYDLYQGLGDCFCLSDPK
jgi:hypothetical protein